MAGRGLPLTEDAMAETSEKKTLRDLLRMVFRRWRLFLVGASLFAISAMLGSQLIPLKYTGETKFERRVDPAAEQNAKDRSESFGSRKLTLEHELIGLDAVARAAEDEGLLKGPDFPRGSDGQLTPQGVTARQELVKRLMGDVKVKWDVRSEQVDLVSVSFTHNDRGLAERMPNTLVRNYIDRDTQQTVDRLSDSRGFLEIQVKECTKRLDDITNKRLEFETKHAGMLPDNPGAFQQQIRDLTRNLDALRVQNTTAREKLARLKAMVQPTTGPSTQPIQVVRGPNPELKALQDELHRHREGLDTALNINRMTASHPTVLTLKKKIAQLEEKIKETPAEAVIQNVYETSQRPTDAAMQIAAAESEVAVTERELTRLQAQQSEYQQSLANYAPIRQQFLQLLDSQKEAEAERTRWQQRLTSVQMDLSAEIAKKRTHLNAVQVAQKPSKPSSPALPIVLGLALAGGLAFGAGLVLLMQMLDRSISTTEEAVSHFDLPIHGVIEEIITPRLCAKRLRRRWILGPAISIVVLATLAVSAVNIIMWLEYHDQYTEWQTSPVSYLIQKATKL